MAGHKPWSVLRDKMTAEQRVQSEKLAAQYREEMALVELRERLDLTQERLAKLLKTKQANVSKIERRGDLMLSTLRNYIHAMGGELMLVVSAPGLGSVRLKGLGELRKSA